MKRILTLLTVLCLLYPVTALAQTETPDIPPAFLTQQTESLLTAEPLMTQTAENWTPTPEPTSVPVPEQPIDIDVTIEQPPAAPVPVADNTEMYLFGALVVTVVGFLLMGYLNEKRDIRRAAVDYEQALNRANENKMTQFDELGIELYLRARGFKVERNPDATYKVTPPATGLPPTG